MFLLSRCARTIEDAISAINFTFSGFCHPHVASDHVGSDGPAGRGRPSPPGVMPVKPMPAAPTRSARPSARTLARARAARAHAPAGFPAEQERCPFDAANAQMARKPGVFAVLDGDGAAIFVGMSRDVGRSVGTAAERGAGGAHVVYAPETDAAAMRERWKAWLAHAARALGGTLPAGNDPKQSEVHAAWSAKEAQRGDAAGRATAAWRALPAERRRELCARAAAADAEDAEAALGLAEALDELADAAADGGDLERAAQLQAEADAALVQAAVAVPSVGDAQARRKSAVAAAQRLAQARGVRLPGRVEESPSAADDTEYARAVFEDYASTYDEHMLGVLRYALPDVMANMLVEALASTGDSSPSCFERLIDCGCGTGLSGIPLRAHVAPGGLVGVDVAEAMAERARARRDGESGAAIYDHVHVGDLVPFLCDAGSDRIGGPVAIVAMDTLNYLGTLESFFAAAAACTGGCAGLMAISVEDTADNDQAAAGQLDRTGRYLHSARYVRTAARDAGWTKVEERTAVGRRERGQDVTHRLFVFAIE